MPFENSWLFPVVESIHVIGLAAFVDLVLEDCTLSVPDFRTRET